MTKKDFKKLGDECFNYMTEVNPKGGMREFIRMAVEFDYKRALATDNKSTIGTSYKQLVIAIIVVFVVCLIVLYLY